MTNPPSGGDNDVTPWDLRRVVTRHPIGFVLCEARKQSKRWISAWVPPFLITTVTLAWLGAHWFAYLVEVILTIAVVLAGTGQVRSTCKRPRRR